MTNETAVGVVGILVKTEFGPLEIQVYSAAVWARLLMTLQV